MGGGWVWILLVRFFLFFWISATAAAGPLVIATRAIFVVLGLVSLDVGVEDIFEAIRAVFSCGGEGGGGWYGSGWHNKFYGGDKGRKFGLSLFDG